MSFRIKDTDIAVDGDTFLGVVTLKCTFVCGSAENTKELYDRLVSTLLDGDIVGVRQKGVLYFNKAAFKAGLLTEEEP